MVVFVNDETVTMVTGLVGLHDYIVFVMYGGFVRISRHTGCSVVLSQPLYVYKVEVVLVIFVNVLQ